jgi:tetratricopeptide (TPR) repeat protein
MRLRISEVLHRFMIGSFAFMFSFALYAQKTGEYSNDITVFKHAKMLYLKQQYVPAIQQFEAYLATDPGQNFTYESTAYIALSRLKLDKNRAALDIRRLLRDHPEHKLNNELEFELGLYYFNKKRYNRALKYLEDINENEVSKEQEEELIF